MAAVAGHFLSSVEVARIHVPDHANHLTRLYLRWLNVSVVRSLVTVLAIDSQGIGEERHSRPELLFGKVIQQADIFECIASELRLLFRVLCSSDCTWQSQQHEAVRDSFCNVHAMAPCEGSIDLTSGLTLNRTGIGFCDEHDARDRRWRKLPTDWRSRMSWNVDVGGYPGCHWDLPSHEIWAPR